MQYSTNSSELASYDWKLKTHLKNVENIKRNIVQLHIISKKSFRGALTNGKLIGICVFNAKGSVLEKINVLFIVPFCFDKFRFRLDTSWTLLEYFLQNNGDYMMVPTCSLNQNNRFNRVTWYQLLGMIADLSYKCIFHSCLSTYIWGVRLQQQCWLGLKYVNSVSCRVVTIPL